MGPASSPAQATEIALVQFDRALFSEEVVLKGCYWLARDFICEIATADSASIQVTIKPRQSSSVEALPFAKETLIQSVSDFALREKIDAKTSGIRDLLLAKAFSEAGVLEDAPTGTFGDKIEQENPQGMFKILGSC
ncbi:MAG TPA: His-Xaa-Ser system protein HxsD [Bryobacteraceae bacterium]|jgi:His-Xaa-Ser system protein HxsD